MNDKPDKDEVLNLFDPEFSTNSFELLKAGMYKCVLYGIVDIGTQEVDFQGETKIKRKMYMLFEPIEYPERNFAKKYTLSNHKKASLINDLTAWIGKLGDNFNVYSLIGRTALLNVVNTEVGDKTYQKIANICPPIDGDEKIKPQHDIIKYSIKCHGFEGERFNALPDWIKKQIQCSHEYLDYVSASVAND
jgi:hypothetical protein